MPYPMFPTTKWASLMLLGSDGPESMQALEHLCAAYWPPLYAYARQFESNPDIAKDSTQAFFAHLLKKETLEQVSPAKGKFRSFLLTSYKNFRTDQHKAEFRQKRRPESGWLDLDTAILEEGYQSTLISDQSPEAEYDRRWALTLLNHAFSKLESEFAARGREQLGKHLLQYLLCEDDATPHAETARRFGLSEGAVKQEHFRLREKLGVLIRAEVAATVGSASSEEEELNHLFQALSASR